MSSSGSLIVNPVEDGAIFQENFVFAHIHNPELRTREERLLDRGKTFGEQLFPGLYPDPDFVHAVRLHEAATLEYRDGSISLDPLGPEISWHLKAGDYVDRFELEDPIVLVILRRLVVDLLKYEAEIRERGIRHPARDRR